MKRFFVLLAALICFGINAYASNVCTVLDVYGRPTTDTIRVDVSSVNRANGVVTVVFSSDSNKPVNAYITISVDKVAKINNESVRIEPFMSGTKNFNLSKISAAGKVTVDISGAKCLK
jgi:hypothetical protein